MKLKDLFNFRRKRPENQTSPNDNLTDEELGELWTQCPSCKIMSYSRELKEQLFVCPKCNYHHRIGAYQRIEYLIDPGTWEELFCEVKPSDPLQFVDLKPYPKSLDAAQKKSGSSEGIITGLGSIEGYPVAFGVMEFAFLGGSMGSVVGERIALLCQRAVAEKCPVILLSSSGGARMHEGLFSLLQMAKTAVSLKELGDAGLLFVSVLADPTYGGVTASFAMLGDIIIAEPRAKIGFAGPRVIEETIRQKLPKDFQTAEYLLEHGQIDLVIPRPELPTKLAQIFALHGLERKLESTTL